jgi:hypothetical protein
LKTYGTCTAKGATTSVFTIYSSAESTKPGGNAYYTGLQSTIDGSLAKPYIYLTDAIAKAYELGAPYASATVTIKLVEDTNGGSKNVHYMRRLDPSEQ